MNRVIQLICACVLATCLFPAVANTGADAPNQEMRRAQKLLNRKDYRGAFDLLSRLSHQRPGDAHVWLALGQAASGLQMTAQAAAAYEKAYADPGLATRAARALFLLRAGAGERDRAYHWFQILEHHHAGDLSGLAARPEIAKLHGDSRFSILFPGKIKFEPPFLEKARIIHEWLGEKAGDEFGWIARAAGDVDGDKVTDVVISAPAHPPYGDGAGIIYLYSGRSGALLWKHVGTRGGLLGNGVEAAGDVNRDGVPDVIAGAPGINKAFVLSGRDGSVLMTLSGEAGDEGFGTKVTGIGDFNGDGYPELAVGAPEGPGGAGNPAYPGYAYVFSGRDGKLLLRLAGAGPHAQMGSALAGGHGLFIVGAGGEGPRHAGRVYVYDKLGGKPKFVRDADATGVALGAMFVSIAGDMNGDGIPDVYASDWANGAHGRFSGRVYVYSGGDGHVLITLDGQSAGEGFGTCAAKTGDVNGDGRADLVIGSWQYHGGAWSGGRVVVYSGADGRVLQSFTSRVPGDTLGFDAVGVGDVDGDGHTDYLITAAWSMVNGIRSGRAFIVAGAVPN